MSKFLHRGDAPFGAPIWQRIDTTIVEAAKSQMTARRLLYVDGPYGLGLKALPSGDKAVGGGVGVNILASQSIPLATIATSFTIPRRDLAAHEERGMMLNLSAAAEAAIACARQEDNIVFNGSKELGTAGLLTAKGAQSMKLGDWTKLGTAADDLIKALGKLDDAGFHGPYSLALAPTLYNLLYRRYAQGNATEMDHVRTMVTDGIVKAPSVKSGGVLVASGRQYAGIVVGQDLSAGFAGPAGEDYEFSLSETLALRLVAPEAVCILK